ncbi:ninjurin-A-like isoform X2 [Frankliniella occidentalis]|nr:ninjurin-A-like isoform X2 [Frankliniella occidentalis]
METPYSHLSAKPFSLPVNTTNMYQLKPLKDPDAEEFPPTRNPSEIGDDDSSLPGGGSTKPDVDSVDGAVNGIDDGLLPEKPSHPYPKPSLDPKFHGEYPPSSIPEIPFGLGPTPEVPDVNVYQHKKTVAQGMMDIALLSANANQMRYVLESGGNHPYYYVSITLIGISLLLQVAVGVGLILNSRYNVSYETSMRKANRINNYTVLAIFLITVMNVFISAFGIASVSSPAFPPSPRIEEGGGPEIELRD